MRRHESHLACLRAGRGNSSPAPVPHSRTSPGASALGHGIPQPPSPAWTDTIEAYALAEAIVTRAAAACSRCLLIPPVPFADNAQLTQVATITMCTSTQQAVLHDVAESLVRQGIDRLVVFNFHGGNDFKDMIAASCFNPPTPS